MRGDSFRQPVFFFVWLGFRLCALSSFWLVLASPPEDVVLPRPREQKIKKIKKREGTFIRTGSSYFCVASDIVFAATAGI